MITRRSAGRRLFALATRRRALIAAVALALIVGVSPALAQSISGGGSSIATPVSVANGGTGQASLTAGALLYGNGTSAAGALADVVAGECLLSGGVGSAPGYASCPGGSGSVPANLTLTAPASAATFTLLGGKTFTVDNTLTFSGTDATTFTFPSTSGSVALTGIAQTWGGTQTFNGGIVLGNTIAFEIANASKWVENSTVTCAVSSGTCVLTSGTPGSFILTLSGASASTTLTITPGFSASHGFRCSVSDTTTSTVYLDQTAYTTANCTLTFYGRTTGASASPGATDVLIGTSFGG